VEFLPNWPLEYNTQIAFGVLLFVGVLGGYLAHRISWLPSITGFMAVGFLIGPAGIDLFPKEAIELARPLINIALALILYRLGLMLDLRAMLHERGLLLISLAEALATFAITFWLLVELGLAPHLAGLAAAIVISSSPAILLHIAHEVGAAGPVTERTKELVALNNLLAFFAFSAALPFAHFATDASWTTALLQPLYRLLGSTLVAILTAWLLVRFARYTQAAAQYRLALVVGALMLGVGIADALDVSELFVPLAMGVTVRTLEGDEMISEIEFGEVFELFFIVLFVYAGAKIKPELIAEVGAMALALVTARFVVKWLAVYGLLRWQGSAHQPAAATGLLLMPMAGLAIGLVQTADQLFSLDADALNALILAAVAILETLGPPLSAYAFRLAGETGKVGSRETATG
jgi:Kef-type K+ transport system membrane component KefB